MESRSSANSSLYVCMWRHNWSSKTGMWTASVKWPSKTNTAIDQCDALQSEGGREAGHERKCRVLRLQKKNKEVFFVAKVGYTLNGRVIRAADVGVATGGEEWPEEEVEESESNTEK